MVLEKVNGNVLRLSGDVKLSDIYARFPDNELFVEPLSSKMPLSEFISSGGFGYGTLREGPLNSKIFSIKWRRAKYSFRYGLTDSTLYAAGYPLQRITAALGSPSARSSDRRVRKRNSELLHELYDKSLGEIQELVIPVRDREEIKVVYEPKEDIELHVPPMARNVLFVNDRAASLVGLPGQGTVVMYPPEATPDLGPPSAGKEKDLGPPSAGKKEDAGEFLENRFIEDKVNGDLGPSSAGDKVLRVLTQKSGASKLYELVGADGLFFALFVNIGLLVIVSGDGIKEQIAEIPLTYSI